MKKANIVILAGQSNAVGVGHAEYLPRHFSPEKVEEYVKGYENVRINFYSHGLRSGGFVPTAVGCTELAKVTLGPEVGMAERYAETHPDGDVFIVKCAVGATAMWRDWLSPRSGAPYDADAYSDQVEDVLWAIDHGQPLRAGWCYNELIKLLGESIELLEKEGYTPRIRGFCWMQGEADADTDANVAAYEARYDNLLADISENFAPYMEEFTSVDAGISTVWIKHVELNAVKEAYAAAAPNRVFIPTIAHGLTTEHEPEGTPDLYHYDSDSVIKLGHLFAEALPL